MAHEVIAGPGYKRMSFVLWLKVIVKLRLERKEKMTVNSPLLVREGNGQLVPMTGSHMSQMNKIYVPILGWYIATIHLPLEVVFIWLRLQLR